MRRTYRCLSTLIVKKRRQRGGKEESEGERERGLERVIARAREHEREKREG